MSGGGVVHCMEAPYDRYIGRGRDPHTGERGEWGNPYSHRPSRVPDVVVVATLDEAISRHERWLAAQLRSGAIPLERMAQLDLETLGCWCRQPGPCHGHTLKRAARWAAEQLRFRERPRPARTVAPAYVPRKVASLPSPRLRLGARAVRPGRFGG